MNQQQQQHQPCYDRINNIKEHTVECGLCEKNMERQNSSKQTTLQPLTNTLKK